MSLKKNTTTQRISKTHTLSVERNHRHAAPLTGSVRNRFCHFYPSLCRNCRFLAILLITYSLVVKKRFHPWTKQCASAPSQRSTIVKDWRRTVLILNLRMETELSEIMHWALIYKDHLLKTTFFCLIRLYWHMNWKYTVIFYCGFCFIRNLFYIV